MTDCLVQEEAKVRKMVELAEFREERQCAFPSHRLITWSDKLLPQVGREKIPCRVLTLRKTYFSPPPPPTLSRYLVAEKSRPNLN